MLPTVANWLSGLASAMVVSGPGVAVAVNTVGGSPSTLASSVCRPAVVPSTHPPDDATPPRSVRDVSLDTRPPPLVTRQRTSSPLMLFPFLSVTRTLGASCSTTLTRPDNAAFATGAAADGTWGSSPHAVSAKAATVRTARTQ